ncbi:hypothetical protein GCM10027429_23800 [Marivirga atlantica]|jgi:hypothetical protein|nr:hypothetical protein [Marivirga atlantica]
MELDDLEDLFDDLGFDEPTPDQLYQMYGIFLNDIARNPIVLNGKTLKYNSNRSKHPVCRGKAQAFEHIITRESKISGKRNFDRDRANKVHWIRPVLLNASDVRIKYFEKINDKGENQHFYWYQEKSFIIIIREIQPDILLITSFSVDNLERYKFKKWYDEYRN